MLYLMGFDLLTGVFVLCPLAVIDKRPGCTWGGVLRNWGLVFIGNFAGALTVAFFASVVCTFGFSTEPDKVGQTLAASAWRAHWATRSTAPPAWRRCSSAACSATGWSPWASSAP